MINHRNDVITRCELRLRVVNASEVLSFEPCNLLSNVGQPIPLLHLLEDLWLVVLSEIHLHEISGFIHLLRLLVSYW